jgi:peptidoglycan/xylan/chitin deacetylase (PgdA/CDA1 family)
MKYAHCVPVLMYHHVSPAQDMITTSPENFERQIAGLAKHGYHALSTEEFAGFLAGKPVAAKSVLITFDDGYLNNWVYAHPILKKYNMRATMFIVTGLIGEGGPRPVAGETQVLPEMISHKRGKAMIAAGHPDPVMVRWSEVHAMQAAGTFEFHSHTDTHTRWDLTGVTREACLAKIQQELLRSRETLQQQFGVVSEHFCWPQGYFEEDYIELAQNAGFRYLYTTIAYGQNRSGSDPAHIYRFAVRNRGFYWLRQRIFLAAHPMIGPLYNRWKLWKRSKRT